MADTGQGHFITALASSQDVVYAGWCGTCNNTGFARGLTRVKVTYTTETDSTGTQVLVAHGEQTNLILPGTKATPDTSGVPNRYIAGIAIDPKDSNHVFLAINGFSRRFTEGPGAGVGHVYESTDGGTTWNDASANLPDVPANSIKVISTGALVLGTDLGVFYRSPVTTDTTPSWQVLGNGLPLTVVMDVELDHSEVYVGTHGRGIWQVALPTDGGESPYAPAAASNAGSTVQTVSKTSTTTQPAAKGNGK